MEWNITQISILTTFAVIVLTALAFAWKHLQKKVGPNEALIVYGPKGTTVIAGGTKFVDPITKKYSIFSLELMSFDVAPKQSLYTTQGIAVHVEAVTQIKVNTNNNEYIRAAAEQFLSKAQEEKIALIRQVMEGKLRDIIGHLRVEDLVSNADYVASQMIAAATPDLERMGLLIASFTIKDVRDEGDYITNLGRPQVEELRRQAETATALINRDMLIQRSNATREAALSCAVADQDRVKADTESHTFQAEAERNLALTRMRFETEIRNQQITAEKANEIHAHQLEQQVIAEKIRVEETKRHLLLLEAQNQADADQVRGAAEAEIFRLKSAAILQETGQGIALHDDLVRQLMSTFPGMSVSSQEQNKRQLVGVGTN